MRLDTRIVIMKEPKPWQPVGLLFHPGKQANGISLAIRK